MPTIPASTVRSYNNTTTPLSTSQKLLAAWQAATMAILVLCIHLSLINTVGCGTALMQLMSSEAH
jgi:hypothetical protein